MGTVVYQLARALAATPPASACPAPVSEAAESSFFAGIWSMRSWKLAAMSATLTGFSFLLGVVHPR